MRGCCRMGGYLGPSVRTVLISKGGFCTEGRLIGLRKVDGPAGGGGGGMNDVADGPAPFTVATGVPTRSSLLMASTLDLRCDR